MNKKITITLTLPEASALSAAIDNCLGDDQDNEAVFGSKKEIAAAYRATKKLNHAIQITTNPGDDGEPRCDCPQWTEACESDGHVERSRAKK